MTTSTGRSTPPRISLKERFAAGTKTMAAVLLWLPRASRSISSVSAYTTLVAAPSARPRFHAATCART
ncbi:hypothetical protein V5799_015794 [Amblyomma americanum]|uniref:Uncharacterized protein n=1 Tax=Amblyomma americanum TaxID=6943 RepID=A0AAQ4F7Z3_AMBAM